MHNYMQVTLIQTLIQPKPYSKCMYLMNITQYLNV